MKSLTNNLRQYAGKKITATEVIDKLVDLAKSTPVDGSKPERVLAHAIACAALLPLLGEPTDSADPDADRSTTRAGFTP